VQFLAALAPIAVWAHATDEAESVEAALDGPIGLRQRSPHRVGRRETVSHRQGKAVRVPAA
jgi:hypothetical protein